MSQSIVNQALSNRTTAIYGDPNVQAATIVPNLNNVSDGTNLNVISDSGQLKLYQALTLNDNFYDTRTEEVYQTNVSNNVVAIQGALMGWVNKQDMVLGINATIDLYNTNAPNNMFTGSLGQWLQPEFAVLQPLVRVEIKLGNNNQIVQRNMMNYAEGLRLIAMDQHYNYAQQMVAAELGLPYSIGTANYSTTSSSTTISNSSQYVEISLEYLSRWTQLIDIMWANGTAAPVAVEFALPLGMVNSFFSENAFLPAGLPFRIEIEYTTGLHYVAFTSTQAATSLYPPVLQPIDNTMAISYNSNFSLRYRSHILKAHVQDSINNEWITKPLLYQYDTYEFVEIIGDNSTVTLLKDIAINQQRPTQLLLRIMPVTSVTNAAPITAGGSAFASVSLPNATATGWNYNNVFVYIGGRQNYYLRMDQATFRVGSTPNPSAAAVNTLVNGRCYDEVNTKMLTSYSENRQPFSGKPFIININPGDFVKKGYMSTDSGAMVIRVQTDVVPAGYTTATALTTNFKLVIYKKYPEQIQINAAKNLNIIQWPAVAASNNYLIPSTYNMN